MSKISGYALVAVAFYLFLFAGLTTSPWWVWVPVGLCAGIVMGVASSILGGINA